MNSKSTIYSRYFTYIKPITKLPIVKNYGPMIFTLLTIAILIYFAIRPTVATILVLQKKLADENDVLQKVTQKANDLSLGKKNFDNLDQSIKDKISASIPNTVSLKTMLQSLEETANAHQASISALQVQPIEIDSKTDDQLGTLTNISFTFNIEGSYQNLLAILQGLKNSSRLISFDNLSISQVSDTKTQVMSISGKAYYIK